MDIYNRKVEFDWYLKCDSDSFFFMDNLHQFLKNKNKSSPVTFGHDFRVIIQNGFNLELASFFFK